MTARGESAALSVSIPSSAALKRGCRISLLDLGPANGRIRREGEGAIATDFSVSVRSSWVAQFGPCILILSMEPRVWEGRARSARIDGNNEGGR